MPLMNHLVPGAGKNLSANPDASPGDPPSRTDQIGADLDRQRRQGALARIVIPPCPALLSRLQRTMAAPVVDLGEVARIAAQDVAMAAALIRAANTPFYGHGRAVRSLGPAMDVLGLQETARVMTAFLAEQALPVNSPYLQHFWQRAGIRAQAMQLLAEKLPGMSADLAYTTGLFSHVGLPVLLHSVRGYGGTLLEAAARVDRNAIATENANHRTDHAVVGALVARVWNLAPPVMAAIRLHHDFDVLGDPGVAPEVQTLVACTLVAEHLVNRDQGVRDDREWPEHAECALRWLVATADDLELWEDELAQRLDHV